jgi:cell wall-associated NlpC family hydrolase
MRHTWLRHVLVAPIAGALVTAAPVAAHASTPATTTLSIAPYRITKAVGAGVTFAFTLASGSSRVGGATVAVYTRPTTTTTWTRSWTRTLDGQGHGSVAFAVARSTFVMVKFAGTAAYAPSHSGGALVTAVTALGQRAVTEASHHQGQPYAYGAVGPTRFDCSGFTMYVWSRFGKRLPHNSAQQYSVVRHIAKSAAQPGDLIFVYGRGGIYHVGVYAGGGYFWHSPKAGDHVRKAPIWTSSYYVGRVA